MEIFKYASDIEKMYEDLINKAKEESLAELKTLRNNQEKIVEFTLIQKQDIVNSVLKKLSDDINIEIEHFRVKLEEIIKNIEDQYQKNKNNLIKEIIASIGLNL
ncbi:MAG TPA: hypothetical protein VGB37_12275 [Candidatus Lokiarchaeia archaeon]